MSGENDIKNIDQPIVDDPDTIKLLEGSLEPAVDDIKTPEPWEERYNKLAESQQSIMDVVGKLTEAVAASQGRRDVVERVVERAPEPPVAPSKRPWEEKLKPEAAEVFKEAVADLLKEQLGQFKEQELNPALRYLVGTQEQLFEDRLARKYDDEVFGYDVLRDDVKKFRAATGNTMDLETAYRQVAFANMMEAVIGSRNSDAASARKQKREIPVDTGGGTPPGALETEDTMDDAERRSAFLFFGRDDKTGKTRSPKEVEALWLEHRRGAKKDMQVD